MIVPLIAGLLTAPSAVSHSPEAVSVLVDSATAGCTGVVVSVVPGKTYILTAKHCSETADAEAVTFGDGAKVAVSRIIDAPTYDLELLEVKPKHSYPAADIAFTSEPLTRFSFYGRSLEVDWAHAEGFISGEREVLKYEKWVQWVTPLGCTGCDVGGSGGGIFSAGKLIGILVAVREDDSMSYMIPSSTIVKFLRDAALEVQKVELR